jgi:hypothetical protein
MKIALVTGITGQDGSYLTEQLLAKGYTVHGMIRRSSSFNTQRIEHLFQDPDIYGQRLFLHHGDLTDSSNLNRLLERIGPDEIYNLAAQSHVKVSFEVPEYTAEVDGVGTLRFLDAIKETGLEKRADLAIHDPKVTESQMRTDLGLSDDDKSVTICTDSIQAATGAHALLVLTEWDVFREIDFEQVHRSMVKPAWIFDGRGLLDHEKLRQIGFKVFSIGKPIPASTHPVDQFGSH